MKKKKKYVLSVWDIRKLALVMKLCLFLLLISAVSVMASSSYSQNTKLTMDLRETTVKDVIDRIEQNSEFIFVFYDGIIDLDRVVSVKAKNATVDEILEQVFESSNNTFEIYDRQIVIASKEKESIEPIRKSPGFVEITQPQKKELTGTVKDSGNLSLPGVSIVVKGTTIGTVTDMDGQFNLSIPLDSKVLLVSFVGMKAQEIDISGKTTINVVMEEESIGIEEVVAVAYGTMKRKDLTGSISTISNQHIAAQANSSVTKALEGAVPGLQVAAIDGQPGLDMGLRVRGLGSTTQANSNALIVIDGVPAQGDNPLSTINPKDIESVTVLKDASSAALYGSRGANGVVLVTTKNGTKGETKISFQGRWGVNQVGPYQYDKISDPKDVYEYTWLSIYNDARYGSDVNYTSNLQTPNMSHDEAAEFASAHLFDYNGDVNGTYGRNQLGNWMLYDVPGAIYTTSGTGSSASSTMSGAYLVNPDGKLNPNARLLYNDNMDKYMLQNKFRQEYNISAQGGSEKMDFYLSLGYLEDPSYIRGSQFHRYNGRVKVNAQLYNWLKVGTNVAYSWRETQMPATRYGRNPGSALANVFRCINGTNQLAQMYARDENGSYVYKDGEKKRNVYNGDSYSPVGQIVAPFFDTDILYMLEHDKDLTESSDIITRSYADITIMKGLTFTTNLGLEKYHSVRSRYWNGVSGQANSTNGAIGKTFTNRTVINTQQLLKYQNNWGKHHIDALLGHEFNKYHLELLNYKSAYGLLGDDDSYANFVGRYVGGTFSSPSGTETANAMVSYLSRVNYEYDSKYYAEASIRRDGSSKFKDKSDRWGTFGSIGLGWRISNEPFMESTTNWLDNLKLRTSFGITGNQNGVTDYANYRTWTYAAASYKEVSNGTGTPTSYKLTLGGLKPAITWEKARTIDFGLEFGLFDFIHGSFDYYNKYTYDGLWARPIANSLGQSSLQSNDAELSNKGFEVELTLDLIKNRNWFWSVTLNGTHYTTILKKIPDGVGNDDLDGCFVQSGDSWSTAGEGGSNGGEYLRGIGKPYYNMYIYEYAGVDQNTGLALFNHRVSADDHSDGLYTNYDIGDKVATPDRSQADKFEKGSAIPDWIGGFSTTLKYKNFDFTGVISYQLGGKFFSTEYALNLYHGTELSSAVSGELIDNTFTPENSDAKFPMVFYGASKYTSGSEIGSWMYTDMSLFSASYMNLKNISIGYNIPKNILQRYGLENVRLYVSADNLLMVTEHSGIDPRMSLVGGFGVGAYTYPSMRTISFGINLDL